MRFSVLFVVEYDEIYKSINSWLYEFKSILFEGIIKTVPPSFLNAFNAVFNALEMTSISLRTIRFWSGIMEKHN